MTVTGTSSPPLANTCVMPSFLPINPRAMSLLKLDLYVDAGRQVELAERVDRLLRRLENVEQALVPPHLELLARLLVDVRRAVDGEALDARRQRNGPRHAPAGAPHRLDDVLHRLIEQPMIVSLEADADLFVHQGCVTR